MCTLVSSNGCSLSPHISPMWCYQQMWATCSLRCTNCCLDTNHSFSALSVRSSHVLLVCSDFGENKKKLVTNNKADIYCLRLLRFLHQVIVVGMCLNVVVVFVLVAHLKTHRVTATKHISSYKRKNRRNLLTACVPAHISFTHRSRIHTHTDTAIPMYNCDPDGIINWCARTPLQKKLSLKKHSNLWVR